MYRICKAALAAALSGGMLFGCATHEPKFGEEEFVAMPPDSANYVEKVDSFVVLLDSSASMTLSYQGHGKHRYAREIIDRMNQTIPPKDYTAALAVFGSGKCVDDKGMVVYGPAPYNKAEFANALATLDCASGLSPMASGVDVSGTGLPGGSGRVALIIVSDFKEIDTAAVENAVDSMRAAHGDSLCVHTIQVGSDDFGSALKKSLETVGGCSTAVHADDILDADDMSGYVETVFLTAAPVMVATTFSDVVYFDFNDAALSSAEQRAVDEVASRVASLTNVESIRIVGHTDSVGSDQYNQILSEERAQTVVDRLVALGVPRNMITLVGMGEMEPAASNDTDEGRALNRRVEIIVGYKR